MCVPKSIDTRLIRRFTIIDKEFLYKVPVCFIFYDPMFSKEEKDKKI